MRTTEIMAEGITLRFDGKSIWAIPTWGPPTEGKWLAAAEIIREFYKPSAPGEPEAPPKPCPDCAERIKRYEAYAMAEPNPLHVHRILEGVMNGKPR